MWIGEWMAARGVRDEMVVATKYSIPYKLEEGVMRSNYGQLDKEHVCERGGEFEEATDFLY